MAEIIAVEGLDGVGKTTTVEVLAAMTGGVDVTSMLAAELGQSRETVMRAASAEARCHYWLAVNYLAGERAANYVADGQTAIIDSYFFRTVVSHRILGVTLDWPSVVSNGVRPDRAAVLTVAEEVRLSRLVARAEADPKPRWHQELNSQSELVLEGYRRFGLLEVDTSVPPASVAGAILADDGSRQFCFIPH
jgi:thymidylate kinase